MPCLIGMLAPEHLIGSPLLGNRLSCCHMKGSKTEIALVIGMKIGPLSQKWVAEHRNYTVGSSFEDVQVSGPFAKWEHTHTMSPVSDEKSLLTDLIHYRLPGGPVGQLLGGRFSRHKLERMFRWRHCRTIDDLKCHQKYRKQPRMKVVITGGSGLIGQELQSLLSTGGHEPIVLTRKVATQDHQRQWDPAISEYDPEWFAGADAVIHLAGENIAGQRWTSSFKDRLWNSRIDVTNKLVSVLTSMETPRKHSFRLLPSAGMVIAAMNWSEKMRQPVKGICRNFVKPGKSLHTLPAMLVYVSLIRVLGLS